MCPTDNYLAGIKVERVPPKGALQKSCPVCANSALRYWSSKFGYEIMKCDSCSHVCAQPLPPKDEIRRGYSGFGETPYITMSSADYYCHLKKDEGGHIGHVSPLVMRLVTRYSSDTATRQWLDIGAGSGYLLKQALLAGWDAQGIEVGHWGAMAAQERHIPIVQGLFEDYEFGAKRFDVLSAIDVLEHTGDVYQFITKCRDLARPGGLLVVALPCSSSPHGWLGFLRRRWAMVGPPSHLHYFSHRSLVHLLKSGGFEPLEFIRYEVGGYPIGKLQLVRKSVDKIARFVVDKLALGDQILVVARSVTMPGHGH